MALIFATGLNEYGGDTADFDLDGWARAGGVSLNTATPTPRTGTYGLKVGANLSSSSATLTLPSAYATITIGCGLRTNSLAYGSAKFLELQDASGTAHLYFTIEATGYIKVWRGGGTALATASTNALSVDTHYYFEVTATINDTTGAVTVRLNESPIASLTLTSTDTRNGGTASIGKVAFTDDIGSASHYHAFDDIVIGDTSGSYNTGFMGACVVEWLLPSGAGNYTQWTPSTGSNYACVDESDPNGDTDYVSDATTGNKDSYALADLASTGGVVRGVISKGYVKKTDANSATLNMGVRSSSTDSWGSDQSPTTSYDWYQSVFETDPATSAAWTISGVNAAEVGIRNNS